MPVSLLSPLLDDYRGQMKTLAEKQEIKVHEFGDLEGLADILTKLRLANPVRVGQRRVQKNGTEAP